jgi:hypothetical protein
MENYFICRIIMRLLLMQPFPSEKNRAVQTPVILAPAPGPAVKTPAPDPARKFKRNFIFKSRSRRNISV